ncbi:hypothetical protein OIU74_017376 [Salix koriyanagi]|uniref:Uncharacterized protein n=1 Tax=Salix koriyanagi TaxID=2511006 RepID=A0A9Q0WP50_9ROSI|nr:hypothetical protein OIU74_017376 [Salix koriyanagi]
MFSLAVICLPTIAALRRLGASVHKLSQVVSEEVPGTLSFLKLSAREIIELTQQLTNLRQKISATDQYAEWKQSQEQQIL